MALALVQGPVSGTVASEGPLTLTFGSPTTAGNFLVLAWAFAATSGTGSPQEQTQKLGGANDNWGIISNCSPANPLQYAEIDADPLCAGGQTVITMTVSAFAGTLVSPYSLVGIAAEFTGTVASTNTVKLYDNKVINNGAGTSTAPDSGNTGQPAISGYEILFGFIASFATANTITGPSSPWTNFAQQSSAGAPYVNLMMGYQVTSAIGTGYDYAGTLSASEPWGAAITGIFGDPLPRRVPIRQAVKRAAYF